VGPLAPERLVSQAAIVREREDLEQSKQNLEVLALALKRFAEMRWDRKRRDAVGRDVARPDAGDIGFACGFVVLSLSLPVIVFDGEAAGFSEPVGVVAALAIDRNAVGGFDGERGNDGLQTCESPARPGSGKRYEGGCRSGCCGGLISAAVSPDAAKGSTSLWIGCARPIHGSRRMQRTQSAKLGMKPRSSITCCSPISRTGTTRPVETVIVGPKKRSSMKMPSA
jgi:hypothetical protein